MFAIDWRLALFSMGSAPMLFAIAAFFRKLGARRVPRHPRAAGAHERVPAGAPLRHEGRAGVRAARRRSRREFDDINVEYRGRTHAPIAADAALYAIVEAVGSIAIAGLLWHGGGRIVAGTLTFGVVVAFIEYLDKFFTPIRDLSTKYTVMQHAMAAERARLPAARHRRSRTRRLSLPLRRRAGRGSG